MKVSVLNLVQLREGQSYKDAIEDMVVLAKQVEKLGYERYWIAEHHNMKTVASSATDLLMEHTLANTSTIRVGSGGVMLPNHAPYIVAERYGTLEVLYPNRVDLGLGRAPGTDMQTARAIRRTENLYPDFATDLAELRGYFEDTHPVHAYPAAGLDIPFYILDSSTDSAYLAAELGFPYVFASHFAPAMLEEAVAIYRRNFKPSKHLERPYVMVGANAILATSNEEAVTLKNSLIQMFLNIVSGNQAGLQPPKESEEEVWKDYVQTNKVPHFGPIAFEREDLLYREKAVVKNMSSMSLVGDKKTVRQQLIELKQKVDVDELIVTSYIYDHVAQLKSFELLAEVVSEL